MAKLLATTDADFEAEFDALTRRAGGSDPAADVAAADIIADVRARGDAALIELTAKFDKLDL
ncbi:MAG: histidinol dehydrogenase, partial [Paracoccaceae bacterium]